MKPVQGKQLLSALLLFGISLIGVTLFTESALPVFAQSDFTISESQEIFQENTRLSGTDIRIIIARIINVFLGLLGVIALGLVLYGGYLWMTAGGDEGKIATAKKVLVNATIGLLIIMSSFALTSFILSRLSDATGFGGGKDPRCVDPEFAVDNPDICGTILNCSDPEYYAANTEICDPECDSFPSICAAERFYVQSITPNTNETSINNVVIRVIFSRDVVTPSDPSDMVRILKDGENVTDQFTNIKRFSGNKTVSFEYDDAGDLAQGTYTVRVLESVESNDDPPKELETEINGRSYPLSTTFTIGVTGVIDEERPAVSLLRINGIEKRRIRDPHVIRAGDINPMEADSWDNAGIGYIRFAYGEVEDVGDTGSFTNSWPVGPLVTQTSDATEANPFSPSYPLYFDPEVGEYPRIYRTVISSGDIDRRISDHRFNYIVVVGAECTADGLPTSEYIGDNHQCLSGGQCQYDWQCISGECDETTGQCVQYPLITDVDPWSGAEGNFVTINGYHFGDERGDSLIEFGVDNDGDGDIEDDDRWIPANQPSACNGFDTWNNTWVVVEVPNDTLLPQGSQSAIRIITDRDDPNFRDATNDDRGPVPGQTRPNGSVFTGFFTKNTEVRPRLCAVLTDPESDQIVPNVPYGPPGVEVRAQGEAFGDTFGRFIFAEEYFQDASEWVSTNALSQVPLFFEEGLISVKIENSAGLPSNGVGFTIDTTDPNTLPVIESFDPPTSTPDAFVTIKGQRFGDELGTVVMATDKAAAIACADPDEPIDPARCISLDATLFPQCENTWSDTQVIAYIPEGVAEGTYHVVLRTGLVGAMTSGDDTYTIVDGPPRPGICSINPYTGPAPLPLIHPGLEISGINFSGTSAGFYWTRGANATIDSTWLDSSYLATGDFTVVSEGTILTKIPVVDGVSMDSGPIHIAELSTGGVSNGYQYTVFDCRDDVNNPPREGYRCCTDGGDAGLWKSEVHACEGEEREAGYVWRFTSGQLPNKPRVVEYCDAPDELVQRGNLSLPSPSPWIGWDGGSNVCLNAAIVVRFEPGEVPVTAASVTDPANVQMFECSLDGNDLDDLVCQTPIENLDLISITDGVVVWDGEDEQLRPNTWYRVELSNNIVGTATINNAGHVTTVFESLARTRPCSDDTAYCFEFKTGDEGTQCIINGGLIHPAYHTTNYLGPIRNVLQEIFYFYVFGVSDQTCTALWVDSLPWEWTQELGGAVTSQKAPGDGFVNSRGSAEALQHTAPDTSDIYADVSFVQQLDGENTITDIRATSTITVDLGNPRVIDFWPTCAEACINAGIGARFNRYMDPATYGRFNAARVYRCTDGETCAGPSRVGEMGLVEVDQVLSDEETIILNLRDTALFEPNTWYVVQLTDEIESIGGYDRNGSIIRGFPLESFEWKFRTKDDPTPCLVEDVMVDPMTYIESIIGRKKTYRSFGLSSPDSCSAQGQILNPWGFDWEWKTADATVAEVTNFAVAGTNADWCTPSCLLYGSTAEREEAHRPFQPSTWPATCGDGTIGIGEECDIAGVGQVPGVTCSFNCLLPGNERTDGTCGNGNIDANLGEQCDINAANPDIASYRINESRTSYRLTTGPAEYCSETCTITGSVAEPENIDINTPICGSGDVTFGEACDINDPGTQEGCTDQCLKAGTPISEYFCGQLRDAGETVPEECATAVSVCGNGRLERGEACDENPDSPYRDLCSPACLVVGDACGTPLAECIAGTPGCSAQCTLLGSSLEYSDASFCGDGVTGAGEFPGCDIGGAGNPLGQPIQYATAVGNGTVTDLDAQTMQTTVDAKIVGAVSTSSIQALDSGTEPEGSGQYILQCGFEEFATSTIQDLDGDTSTHDDRSAIFNDCADTSHGVGNNTCCYPRPMRIQEYPIADQTGVCRNTYIEATYDTVIDEETLEGNVTIAEYHNGFYNCAADGKDTVTELGQDMLIAYEDGSVIPSPGFFQRVWNGMKGLFHDIFGGPAFAAHVPFTLCSSGISLDTTVVEGTGPDEGTSDVIIYIQSLLAENQQYAVLLTGGLEGVKSMRGVGIAHENGVSRNDGWIFTTGADICKLKEVTVEPPTYEFRRPFASSTFVATGVSTNDQLIVSIDGVYQWDWGWIPQDNPLFTIPAEGDDVNTPVIDIASKNLEGELSIFAQATVVADVDTGSANHLGEIFSGKTDLYANFCDNTWPARVNDTWQPFQDTEYNFSFSYCADAGAVGDQSDDYPFFTIASAVTQDDAAVLEDQTLKRYFMVNNVNEDVIGIQIFENADRKSLCEWYDDQFSAGSCQTMQPIEIDGYQGLTNGSAYYISALNQTDRDIDTGAILSNHVYLFILNGGAQAATRSVFDQILDTLVFNINIENTASCIAASHRLGEDPAYVEDTSCSTDFDCRDGGGHPIEGASGFCGNGRDKLLRDLDRLAAIQQIQTPIRNVDLDQGQPPTLRAGTYYNTYTNSQWPSWQGTLGTDVQAALPQDPINQWSICDAEVSYPDAVGADLGDPVYTTREGTEAQTCWNASAGQYHCPVYQQIFEYAYNPSTTDYMLHGELEYLTKLASGTIAVYADNTLGSPLFTELFIDTTHFTENRWCEPEQVISPFGAQCGDGVVQRHPVEAPTYYETCELGQTRTSTCSVGSDTGIQSEVCSATCNAWVPTGACSLDQVCGNGVVEGDEICDDGALNGTYGHCAGPNSIVGDPTQQCKQVHPQYCDNGVLDFNDLDGDGVIGRGEALEFCENGGGGAICQYAFESGQLLKPQIAIVVDRSYDMGRQLDGTFYNVTNPNSSGFNARQASAFYQAFTQMGAELSDYRDDIDTANSRIIAFPGFWETQGVPPWNNAANRPGRQNTDPECFRQFDPDVTTWPQHEASLYGYTANIDLAIPGNDLMGNPLIVDGFDDITRIDHFYGRPTFSPFEHILNNVDSVYDTSIPSQKVVMLVTNGRPSHTMTTDEILGRPCSFWWGQTCAGSWTTWHGPLTKSCDSSLTSAAAAEQRTIDLAEALFDRHGIVTYVVGLGENLTAQDVQWLNDLAVAGGSGDADAALSGEDQFFRIDQPDELADGILSIFQCQDHNLTEAGTCNMNTCQSYGSYCGDGTVDALDGEECDDGGRIAGDGCSEECKIESGYTPPDPTLPAGICGNGAVEAGEECDSGNANGRAPEPHSVAYGRQETYCSNDCRILTVDSAKFCGNGVRDWVDIPLPGNQYGVKDTNEPWAEACDLKDNGQVTRAWDASDNLACLDKGEYFCANQCQLFYDTCVTCGVYAEGDPYLVGRPNARAYIGIVNPLFGWNNSGYSAWLDDTDGSYDPNYAIVADTGIPYRTTGGTSVSRTRYDSSSTDSSNNNRRKLSVNGPQRFITDPLCQGEYTVSFNALEFPGLNYLTLDSPLFDQFDFPVQGELSEIWHDYVISPAVPVDTFRLVARWTDEEQNQNVRFTVGILDPLGSPGPSVGTFVPVNINYLRAKGDNNECRSAAIVGTGADQYWSPTGCSPYNIRLGAKTYVHTDDTGMNKVFMQAQTLEVDSSVGATWPIAIYVEALSAATSDRLPIPIIDFQNSNLTFEIYGAHEGQELLLSVFKPDHVMEIKGAAGTSSNSVARYWHVANIMRNPLTDEYIVLRVPSTQNPSLLTSDGSIETDICGIRANNALFGDPGCPSP